MCRNIYHWCILWISGPFIKTLKMLVYHILIQESFFSWVLDKKLLKNCKKKYSWQKKKLIYFLQKEEVCTDIVLQNPVIEPQPCQQQPPEETIIDVSPPTARLVDQDNEENSNNKPFVAAPNDNLSSLESLGGSTFDYLYEFSETRKVLEEFFKCPAPSEEKENTDLFPFQVN